jgi:hypothetical protein
MARFYRPNPLAFSAVVASPPKVTVLSNELPKYLFVMRQHVRMAQGSEEAVSGLGLCRGKPRLKSAQ